MRTVVKYSFLHFTTLRARSTHLVVLQVINNFNKLMIVVRGIVKIANLRQDSLEDRWDLGW